jgi:hypothetical protein
VLIFVEKTNVGNGKLESEMDMVVYIIEVNIIQLIEFHGDFIMDQYQKGCVFVIIAIIKDA